MKIEFSPQRREMHLFSATNMAAVTSLATFWQPVLVGDGGEELRLIWLM